MRQDRYGLTDREDDDLLDLCGRRCVAFVPFVAVAAGHHATAAQVRLAWTLHRGSHVLAIPGTGDSGQLEQNLAAAALRLSDDELRLLDGIAAPRPGDGGAAWRPGWSPSPWSTGLNAGRRRERGLVAVDVRRTCPVDRRSGDMAVPDRAVPDVLAPPRRVCAFR